MEVNSDLVPIDPYKDPVDIQVEHHSRVREIRARVEGLFKLRQEIGRLFQIMSDLSGKAAATEDELRELRLALAAEYGLDRHPGQWVIDFEKNQFVMADQRAAVIP